MTCSLRWKRDTIGITIEIPLYMKVEKDGDEEEEEEEEEEAAKPIRCAMQQSLTLVNSGEIKRR
eukprot:SAG11_NODE_7_length_31267_cov_19.541966_4_plen_64_part_00